MSNLAFYLSRSQFVLLYVLKVITLLQWIWDLHHCKRWRDHCIMGSSEADASAKTPRTSVAQEQTPATSSTPSVTVYPDWSSFQVIMHMLGEAHQVVTSSDRHIHQFHLMGSFILLWHLVLSPILTCGDLSSEHLMPPYGAPPAPYVMYPPGGLYPHPSMPPGAHPFSPYAITSPNSNVEASGAIAGVEVDGKSSGCMERSPLKRSKGSLGSLNMITGKNNNEPGKTSGQPTNGTFSQSGESGSDSSSEGSDANSQNISHISIGVGATDYGQLCRFKAVDYGMKGIGPIQWAILGHLFDDVSQDSHTKTARGHESHGGVSQSSNFTGGSQNGVSQTPSQAMLSHPMAMVPLPATPPGSITGPTTNLNIGIDYWSTPSSSPIPMHGKIPATAVGGAVVPGAPSDLWLQVSITTPFEVVLQILGLGYFDERELKRQKRKQSNRESARRSRLRKQAEYEELAVRAEALREENANLRAELTRIKKEYEQLEKLSEPEQGADDPSADRKEQGSVDENSRMNLDSDTQAAKRDQVQMDV
ncbi:hypothetical protein ZIOFF_003313 [Zingiber officinale]|uniref:BZIP domain-containing protein n=1 Tax=Zingiber officinale TaxID=94328 RepID=A0A8J5LZQ0_ZINOF|nr:hypothetical protein ZIOFF_003313 [Zingiber officinale]